MELASNNILFQLLYNDNFTKSPTKPWVRISNAGGHDNKNEREGESKSGTRHRLFHRLGLETGLVYLNS